MNKFLTPTAPASIVGPVIGHNVIPTSLVLQKRASQGSAPADDSELATVNFDENCMFLFKWPQKRQLRESSVDATQPSMQLIPDIPQKGKPGRHHKSVAAPLTVTGLFDYAQRDSPPLRCTTKAHSDYGALVDRVRNA